MLNTTTVTFAGNLANDPELRYTTGGTAVAEFRILVNRRTKDDAGEWTDAEPTGHSCKVYGPSAENVAETLTKGIRALVAGHIETQTWNDRESGDKRTKDVVIVDAIGADLTYATATVQKVTKADNGQ